MLPSHILFIYNFKFFLWLKFLFHHILFKNFIGFIMVKLVKKIIHVSSVQVYNTASVHYIMCSPSKVESLSITIYSPFTLFYLPQLLPSSIVLSLSSFFCLIPLSFSSNPHPPNSCQFVLMFLSLFFH